MSTVLRPPPLRFTCDGCKAFCEGNDYEFRLTQSNPPLHEIKCPWCHGWTATAQPALIARYVATGNLQQMLDTSHNPMMTPIASMLRRATSGDK